MKTLRRTILGSSLLLLVGAQGQDVRPADVLASPDDTTKVLRLSDLCFAYRRIDGDSALLFGRSALELARALHWAKGEAQAFNDMSIILMDRSAYAQADSLLRMALRIRITLGDSAGMAAIHNKLGNIFQSQLRIEEALNENFEALRIYERRGPPAHEAAILNNIAILQFNLRRYDAALSTHRRGAAIRKAIGDEQGLAESKSNMANVQLQLGDTGAAVALFEETASYFRAHNLKRELGIQLNNLAGVHLAQHRYEQAAAEYREALAIRKGIGEKKAIASSMAGLGGTFLRSGRVEEARPLLLNALRIAQEVNARNEELQALLDLSRIYARRNMGDSTFHYHERYTLLKDSIFNDDLNARMAEMETKYESEKKEREILDQRTDLAVKRLEIAELGKRADRRRFWLVVAVGGIALVVVSALLFFQVQRRRARAAKDAALLAERDAGLRNMLLATDNERKRIASELHDGVGQQLTGLKFRLEDVASRLAIRPEDVSGMKEILSIATDASHDVRTIAHQMMPRALGELGLVPALEDMLRKSLSRPGMHYTFEHFGLDGRLPPDAEVGVYRIVQELTGNIIKHAAASHVNVQLLKNKGHLVLIIEDDGKGIDVAKGSGGMGMSNLADRARVLGGTIGFDGAPGRGTVVTVRVPVTEHHLPLQ